MPKFPKPFELDEDDFLKEFPTFDSLLFGEIEPPAWALRALQKRGGHKHAKREIIPTPWAYSKGFSPSGIVPFVAVKPSGGYEVAHYPAGSDAQAIFDKATAKGRRRQQEQHSRRQMSERKLVPQGNLLEDDYRYWKGYAISTANADEGSCRWCERLFKGRERMLNHHEVFSCKQHLMALYRYAKLSTKTQRYCFACKEETLHDRWGVPMCDRHECITRWKFNFNVQLPGYQQYRQWALEAQIRAGHNGPFGSLPPHDALDDAEDDFFRPGPC